MAPNKRGTAPSPNKENRPDLKPGDEPYDFASSVITKEEVEARGSGTREARDSYDPSRPFLSELRVFFTGIMFLTRLPVPTWVDHHPAYLMRALMWFPLIGATVGLWGAAWYNAAALLWPQLPTLAGAISTLATVWLTGCFHEDGLADSIDGLGGGWGRDQILRIMKDSRVGTYALVGTTLILQAKTGVLGALGPARCSAALVAAHAAARWTALPLTYGCHYIQDAEDAKRGLYNWFAQSQRLLTPPRLAFGTLSAVAVVALALPAAQALAVGATVVGMTIASAYYGHSVLGGVVGDYLGATIAVTELAIYLVLTGDWAAAAVRWQPLAVLAATAALPIIYTRRIIQTGGANC